MDGWVDGWMSGKEEGEGEREKNGKKIVLFDIMWMEYLEIRNDCTVTHF